MPEDQKQNKPTPSDKIPRREGVGHNSAGSGVVFRPEKLTPKKQGHNVWESFNQGPVEEPGSDFEDDTEDEDGSASEHGSQQETPQDSEESSEKDDSLDNHEGEDGSEDGDSEEGPDDDYSDYGTGEGKEESGYDDGLSDEDGYSPDESPETQEREDGREAIRDAGESEAEGAAGETAGVAGEAAAGATTEAAAAGTEAVGAAAAEGGIAAFLANPVVIAILLGVLVLVVIAMVTIAGNFNAKGKNDSNAAYADCNSSKTIVIDPGHPSENGSGGSGHGLKEVELVYDMALLLKPKLEAKGYKVVLTRNNNTTEVSNKARAEIGNNNNAAINFRIHTNGGGGKGLAYYYPAEQGTVDGVTGPSPQVIESSKSAAQTILDSSKSIITKAGMSLEDGGLKTDKQTLIGGQQGGALTGSIYSQVPTVLVEAGYLDNFNDAAWLKSKTNLESLADAFSQGIVAYVGSVSDSNCSSGEIAQKAIALAKSQQGDPYVYGAPGSFDVEDPDSFDCSGLVGWAFYWASDKKIRLAHQTKTDYNSSLVTKINSESELIPGDLIFNGPGGPETIHHVSIYIGNGQRIHAPQTGDVVKISDISHGENLYFARVNTK